MGIVADWRVDGFQDSSEELLAALREEFSDEEIIYELRKWMGEDEFNHALEDIIEDNGLTDANEYSEAYEQYLSWYSNLSYAEKSDVAEILVSIELDDIEHMSQEDFDRIQDIFDFMHS